jgi:hypothetical protein
MLREDADEPVGLGVGQRLQENAAHHAVDRSVPPMASPSVRATTIVKPGFFERRRPAKA